MAYGSGLMDVVQSSTVGTPPQFNDGGGTQVGTLCRAWVNFVGSSGSITASFNVSSVTRNGTGDYTINFTNALSDANYTIATCPQLSTAAAATRVLGLYGTATDGTTGVTKTTSAVRMACQISSTAAAQDMVFNGVTIFR